jgi:acyl-CoA thioester hydrolase
MPAVFLHPHSVCDDEIDILGHANNLAYLKWMQSAALAHSAAQGWPSERYQSLRAGWVVRSHTIKYSRSALAGDEIVVRTWVADMKRFSSTREYRIERTSDGALLARAATQWAFVDFTTGGLARIPPEVSGSFEVIGLPDDEEQS